MKSTKLLVTREKIYLTKELESLVPVETETNLNLKIATQVGKQKATATQ